MTTIGASMDQHANSLPPICGPHTNGGDRATVEMVPLAAIDADLISRWRDLVDHASEPNAFHEPDFLQISLSHCDPGHIVQLCCIWASEPRTSPLIGLLPLRHHNGYGRWPVAFTRNWLHSNMFLGTALIRIGNEAVFWAAILQHLDRDSAAGLFFHLETIALTGPVFDALKQVCAAQNRRCDIVEAKQRAVLRTTVEAAQYYADTVRKKKRKELNRLRNRLSEMGTLETINGTGDQTIDQWICEFMALEQRGWKGDNHSALSDHDNNSKMFAESLKIANAQNRLHLIALRLDGEAIAMLASFLSPPAGFSFKTAFDEDYGQFSPGVLLQIDNFDVLAKNGLEFMDSCAAQDHPMINSLWLDRRAIGRVSIGLKGVMRTTQFRLLRLGEDAMTRMRGERREAL